MRFTRRGYGRLLRDDGTEVSRHVVAEEAYESAARTGPGSYTWQPAPISIVVEPHDCEVPGPTPDPDPAPDPDPTPDPQPDPEPEPEPEPDPVPAPSLPDLVPGGTAKLPTEVVLTMDDGVQPTAAELVTFGLPLSAGEITDPAALRVRVGGVEVPVSVRTGLRWHWLDGSLRSVTVQLVADMTGGDVTVTVDGLGRDTSRDLVARPVLDGWVESGFADADGRALLKPRVLPLHDPDYLAASGLLPPFAPPTEDDDANVGIWATTKGVLDNLFPWGKTAEGAIDYDSWLFDRPGTLAKLSMQFRDRAKRRALLRNFAVSKRHYFNNVGASYVEGGPGYSGSVEVQVWWGLKRKAANPTNLNATYGTTMYQQCQGAKLALALLGDDTQWTDETLRQWASDIRATATNAAGPAAGKDYTASGRYEYPQGFTERLAAIPSLFQLHAWEITADPAIRASLDQRVAYLKDMQQRHKPHEIANGWPASEGVFRHSISKHDPNEVPVYVCNFVQPYPAGTQVANVTTVLSDADIERWVAGKKSFALASIGGVTIDAATKNADGTWTFTFSKPLPAAVAPGGNFECTGDMYQPPYVEADQGFSPWMSVFIADYLWQQYSLIGGDDIPEILRRLGNGINARGFASRVNDDGTFTQDIPAPAWLVGPNSINIVGPQCYPLYMATDVGPRAVCNLASFTHTHNEMIFPLALALLWETDPVRRLRLQARCQKIEEGLFHAKANFAPQVIPNPRRMLNWQHSASPLRTWRWVAGRVVAA